MKHTIAVVTPNNPGVVSRLSGLLERRGFRVNDVGVGATHKPNHSRFTFVIDGDAHKATQAVRQLRKMVEALEVRDLSAQKHIARCMLLMKFALSGEKEMRLETRKGLFEALKGQTYSVLEDDENTVVLEMMAAPEKADDCLDAVRAFGLCEAVKSGPLALGM